MKKTPKEQIEEFIQKHIAKEKAFHMKDPRHFID